MKKDFRKSALAFVLALAIATILSGCLSLQRAKEEGVSSVSSLASFLMSRGVEIQEPENAQPESPAEVFSYDACAYLQAYCDLEHVQFDSTLTGFTTGKTYTLSYPSVTSSGLNIANSTIAFFIAPGEYNTQDPLDLFDPKNLSSLSKFLLYGLITLDDNADFLFQSPSVAGTYTVFAVGLDEDNEVSFLGDLTQLEIQEEPVVVAEGYVDFAPSADSRMIHISSSLGDDSNPGTVEHPLKSIGAGINLLRKGYPDWLLFKKGDTWNYDNFAHTNGMHLTSLKYYGGRSPEEPMVITSYGSGERPLFLTGAHAAMLFDLWNAQYGPDAPVTLSNLAIDGLHFFAHDRQGQDANIHGIKIFGGPTYDFTVQDCVFDSYETNISIATIAWVVDYLEHDNIRIIRNVIKNAFQFDSNIFAGHGAYISNTNNLEVRGNVFYHNGWNDNLPIEKEDYQNHHHTYLTARNSLVLNNIFMDAAMISAQLRRGGTAINNLIVRGTHSIYCGTGNQPYSVTPERCQIIDNVVIDPKDKPGGAESSGMAMNIANTDPNDDNIVQGNIFANNENANNPVKLQLDGRDFGGVRGLTLRDNIWYNWGGWLKTEGPSSQFSDIEFSNNDVQEPFKNGDFQNKDGPGFFFYFQGGDPSLGSHITMQNNRFYGLKDPNTWFGYGGHPNPIQTWNLETFLSLLNQPSNSSAEQVSYPDPERSVGSYNATLGGANSFEAFRDEVLKLSKDNWRYEYTAPAVNDYIRGGFGK